MILCFCFPYLWYAQRNSLIFWKMHLFPFIHCNSRFLKNYILNRLIVDLGAKTSLTELNSISSVNVNCTQCSWSELQGLPGSCCYNKVGYLEASFKVEFMGINDHAHKLNSRVLTAVKNEIPYLYTSLGLEVFLQPQLLQSNAIQIRHASLRHLSIGFIYLPTEATFISYTVYGTTIRGVVLCPVGSHGSSVVSLFQCKTQYRGKKYRNT